MPISIADLAAVLDAFRKVVALVPPKTASSS